MYDDYLMHYGIKGMHWGVRRTPEQLGHLKIPKNASHKNLHLFGKDKDHNVLYIMGASGSGKSTVARQNRKNANIIHLDGYIDGERTPKSKEFNQFMRDNNLDPNDIPHSLRSNFHAPETWAKVDKLGELIEAFGQQQFNKRKRVIVEGVQLMDETIYPDKSYFKSKPFIVLNTSSIVSTIRASKRDQKPLKFEDIKNTIRKRKMVRSLKQKLGVL